MGTPFYQVRRQLAQEMNLWGGNLDGASPGPATFTSVDPQGSLFTVYDTNRPEPDEDWDSAYICINPGGSGDSNLSTIWRRVSDEAGFISSTGAMTLTVAVPSLAYAAEGMTYELFKTFTPEQWLKAINWALRTSYPQRHRIIAFEAQESSNTIFYDWGHLATLQTLANPSSGPSATAISDPGGHANYWASGTYKVAYNIFNAAGETLISSTTTVAAMTSAKVIEFAPITVPQNAVGVNYFCTADPGGTTLTQLDVGSGVLPDLTVDNITPWPGLADRTTFIVPKIRFWGPPPQLGRTVPAFNTTGLDLGGMSLKTVRRRLNPGQYPEQYIDLNPEWWREIGGTSIKLNYRPDDGFALRFECMAPVRFVTGESDATEEPLDLMIAGGMLYLWNLLAMTGSSQNVTIWTAEAKVAEANFRKARNLYQMPGPRKTLRRPFIRISRWNGGW